MSWGAVVIPLFALVLCGGAMWFAWRVVRLAGAEGEPPASGAPPADAGEQARRRSTKTAGVAIALLAMLAGLLGIAFLAWRAFAA